MPKFRFVIVTVDGKRYAAKWRNSVVEASDAADELVLRRGLLVGRFVGHVKDKKKPGGHEDNRVSNA